MIDIIKRPLITEKAMSLQKFRQYSFEVSPQANKIQIRKAIEEMFEVHIESIRTVRTKGKVKSRITRRGLMKGKTPMRKKAYVTLKKGESIDIVSGAQGT